MFHSVRERCWDGGKNVAAFSFNKVRRLVETVFASIPLGHGTRFPGWFCSKRAPRRSYCSERTEPYSIDKRDRYEVSFNNASQPDQRSMSRRGVFWRGTPSQRPRSYFHSIRIFLLVLLFSVIFSFPKKEILKFMTRIRQFRRFLYHDVTLVTEQLYLCFYILVGYFYGQGETMCWTASQR